MEMVEAKTAEMVSPALDWAVALADKNPAHISEYTGKVVHGMAVIFAPSTNWDQGGPLIDKYAIGFVGHDADNWLAFASPEDIVYQGIGATHLIAACRLIVSAKLGETVLAPKELVK